LPFIEQQAEAKVPDALVCERLLGDEPGRIGEE